MSPPPFSPELCRVSAAKLASPKPKHPLRFRAAAMQQAARRLSGKPLNEEGNRALEADAVPMVVVSRLDRLADDVGRERGGLKRRLAAQHSAREDRRIDIARSVAHLLKLRIEIVLHRRAVGNGAPELVWREADAREDDVLRADGMELRHESFELALRVARELRLFADEKRRLGEVGEDIVRALDEPRHLGGEVGREAGVENAVVGHRRIDPFSAHVLKIERIGSMWLSQT